MPLLDEGDVMLGSTGRFRRRIRPDFFLGALVALVVTTFASLQLFWGADLGLADNGDVRRVLCASDLQPAPNETKFGPAVFKVQPLTDASAGGCDNPDLQYGTSQVLLVDAVRLVDGLVSAPGIDLRAVGALSALLFGVGVGLLYVVLPGGRTPRLLAVAGTAVLLLDVSYLHFFSSGYSETAGFLGLLWTTVALAWLGRGPMRLLPVLATVLAGMFLITAKSQLTPLAAVLVVALAARWIVDRHQPGLLRRTAVATGASLALVLTGGAYLDYQGPGFHNVNVHNLVMFSVLPLTSDPAAALEEMGLDTAMAPHSGSSAFSTSALGQPEHEEFLRDAGRVQVLKYLADRPSVAWELMRAGLQESTQARLPHLLEHAEPGPSGSYLATDRHDAPGRILASTRDAAPILLPALWVVMSGWGIALLTLRRFHERGSVSWALPLLFACSAAATQVVVALVGDGTYELSKHVIYVSWSTFLAVALTCGSLAAMLRRSAPAPVDGEPMDEPMDDEPMGAVPVAVRALPSVLVTAPRELVEADATVRYEDLGLGERSWKLADASRP